MKGRLGIANMYNILGVCSVHEGKAGTDQSAQGLNWNHSKMVFHSTASRRLIKFVPLQDTQLCAYPEISLESNSVQALQKSFG